MNKLLLALIGYTLLACSYPAAAEARLKEMVSGPAVHKDHAMVIAGVIANGNLKALGQKLLAAKDYVDLVIDSPGGSIETGNAFISYMEAAKAKGVTINCFVPRLAASMAFGILAHCNKRYTLSHAFLLWHRARVSLGDSPVTSPQLKALSSDLAAVDEAILRETVEALGIDEEIVRYHFEVETLHLGSSLATLAPDFITALPTISGALEALSDNSIPRSETPFPFSFQFGQIIHIYLGVEPPLRGP